MYFRSINAFLQHKQITVAGGGKARNDAKMRQNLVGKTPQD
jgi:hypothetical protein